MIYFCLAEQLLCLSKCLEDHMLTLSELFLGQSWTGGGGGGVKRAKRICRMAISSNLILNRELYTIEPSRLQINVNRKNQPVGVEGFCFITK